MRPRIIELAAAAALITGCTLGPTYERPAAELPAHWTESPPKGVKAPAARWWTMYGDPALDRLVEEAFASNQDLALATARVDEARALSQIADSRRMPTVDASFERDRVRLSERSPIPLPPSAIENNSYRAQLNVAYEVDLWGRLKSASNAARAELLASAANRETVRIALTTEVVRAYFALVAFDAQVEATRRSLALRSEGFALQKVRFDAGLINEFALRQIEAEVAAARAQLPALEANRTAQELALAVLLGRSPRAIMEGAVARRAEQGEPAAPVVPEGLPSDLLLRRPDVVSSEQILIANNARISEARAALFPRIGLSGYLGSESTALSDLFSGPAAIWSLGIALSQPIFQGGRLFAEVEAVKARERQAIAQYQKTLQEAFREVRQALNTQVKAREAFEAESVRTVALEEALRLAFIRYRSGLLSQLEVLDSERNLLQAELNRSDALRAQRAAVADLVKALGGGWQGFDTAPIANAGAVRR
ncbi:MAG TPA: efflux transporter outer membrane subunit [Burkholderiales bacterium]|nr:efflux transporter outer membrane subunit [Burkholderiales bacterium]